MLASLAFSAYGFDACRMSNFEFIKCYHWLTILNLQRYSDFSKVFLLINNTFWEEKSSFVRMGTVFILFLHKFFAR